MTTQSITQVPFLDLKRQYATIKDEVAVGMQEVIDSCAFAGGPFTAKFETSFAEYCQTNYAVGVNSGTSALHLAMLALGIGPGDEVILPANTFIATAWGISYVGATPVFVDCDEYYNIDPDQIEAKITDKTKAIAAVHLYGQPFDVDRVKAIADKHQIYLVEDAAQAHGAYYRGKRVGGFGEMACFSFYPGKNLGAYGEGGGITTNNEAYVKHLHSLRNHGAEVRYYHDEIGFNMRLDGIQSAVLSVKLPYLDQWNEGRRKVAARYHNEITNPLVKLPKVRAEVEPVYHLFVVTVEDREHFQKFLSENGIGTGLHYPVPCHLQKAYADLGHQKGDFPKSEYLAEHCVSLPIFAEMSGDEVSHTIAVINSYQNNG